MCNASSGAERTAVGAQQVCYFLGPLGPHSNQLRTLHNRPLFPPCRSGSSMDLGSRPLHTTSRPSLTIIMCDAWACAMLGVVATGTQWAPRKCATSILKPQFLHFTDHGISFARCTIAPFFAPHAGCLAQWKSVGPRIQGLQGGASWCSGSTSDSKSDNGGSIPSEVTFGKMRAEGWFGNPHGAHLLSRRGCWQNARRRQGSNLRMQSTLA